MDNCRFYYQVIKAMKSEVKRVVILHRHIFKNAGTTFDSILKNNFSGSFCDHRDDIPMHKEGQKYLIRYLIEHPEIKALSSHHIWFNFSKHSDYELIPVMFLRHPIERIRSVYNFERQQQADTPGAVMAKMLDFNAYVAWRMQDDVSPVIRNMHTRYLAGVKGPKPLRKKHLRVAIKSIEQNPFIGVVDLFDESLQIFDNEFKKMGIVLDFSYTPQNVMQPAGIKDCETRTKEVLNELGELVDIVLEKNSLDLELYQMAKNKIVSDKRNF